MRVLVCGGRDFNDERLVNEELDKWNISTIIEGGATGADRLARQYAERRGIPVRTFPASWSKYGKSAGYIRNAEMLNTGLPELTIAFPGGKGTANMIMQAKKANVEVYVVDRV